MEEFLRKNPEIIYYETSALDGSNVNEVFAAVAQNHLKVQAWTVKYPGATPSASRTRSYTDADSSKTSARHCVEWVWQQHRKTDPSVECPWDVGDPCCGQGISYTVLSIACALPPSEATSRCGCSWCLSLQTTTRRVCTAGLNEGEGGE